MKRLVIALFAVIMFYISFFPNCFADTTWQSIGPFGGRIQSLAIDPSNSQTVYAGTLSGGVFKSTNGGALWTAASSGMTNTNVLSLAIDPTNSQTVYAGTGGGGVFKSTNGGASWTAANSGITSTFVQSLAIDRTNSQTVYAGTLSGGVFKSTNGGALWTAASSGMTNTNVLSLAIDPTNSQTVYAGTGGGGVFKSTNGGASWTAANSGTITSTQIYSIAIDPSNSQTVYAGTSYNGIFKSTNGGASWIAANSGNTSTQIYSLAIDPTNSQTVYAGTSGNGIFKSTNGGASWTAANSRIKNTWVWSIAIDPTNSQTVYAGTYAYGDGVFKSTNGGASWNAANRGIADTDVRSLAIDPTNNQTVYAGTEGDGLYKSTNGGASWTMVSSGMLTTIVYSLAIDPTNSQTVYAGTYGGVSIYKSTNSGVSWIAANSGLPNENVQSLAIDPTNSQTVYAGTTGGVFKSTNGGASWTAANSGITNTFVESLAIDSTNSQTVYAGTDGGGVFKSTNGGISWIAANSGLTNTYVQSIAIDQTNSRTVYAGTYGGVFKSTNGGASWTAANSGITNTWVYSLAIDPTNSQTVYVGTDGGVFKSINGGASWIEANSGMTDTTVYSLAIDPTNSQTVCAGTVKGVFKALSNDFPVITSASTAAFSEGVSGTFIVTASGWPTPQFSISGTLPSGVSFDTATGTIRGIPAIGSAGTYPLIITATNGIPPDATCGITLTVLPAGSLAATISSPIKGTGLSSLATITGTASGSGLSKVEVQITDGTYYLQSNGSFALTSSWLTASGTTSWTLNTGSVTWREGITYTIYARASNGSNTSVPTSSTFTIMVPTSKTVTILSMTINPDTIRAGDSTTISGLLVKADTTAVSSQTVTLIITPPSTAAHFNPAPVIITALTTNASGAFTSGALSLFALPGVYMVEARFEGNSTLASSFASEALAVTPQSGYAIIISGKTTDNSLLDMHTASTEAIYSTLVNKRGFLPENIQYLKSTTSAPATKQQLQDAITVWARNKLIASPAPLYIIMIDHGSQTGFIMDTDTLTPDQLKGYLDTLESDTAVIASGTLTTYNRIIMIGTCYSGIFAVLSKPGRVVITSANTDEQSIAGFTIYNSGSNITYYGGEYFIDNMFNYLGRGDTLKDAFTQSSTMVGLRDPRKVSPGTHAGVYDTLAQHPLLDDNGDSRASYILATDGLLAANLRLGVGIRSLGNPADIIAVTDTTTIPATQTAATPLWLRVNDNSRIAKAWMEIRTPITSVSSTGGSGQVIPHLITLPLYYDGIQWYGSYTFPNAGTYNILYYTQDNQTSDIAPAKNSVVYRELAGNVAPAGFTLTSPNDAEAVSPMFLLTWQGVTSPNKITYTLQVATDQSFANVVYKEESIPQAATYMPKDALKRPGTSQYYCQNGDSYCYWRVQAIDIYGATSSSNTRSFTIVSTNVPGGIIVGWITPPVTGATIRTDGNGSAGSLPNGYFCLSHPAGAFTLTVAANGYNPYSTSVTVGELAVTNVTITLTSTSSGAGIPGDLDGDGAVTVADAIIALQVMSGMQPPGLRSDYPTSGADVSGDAKVELPEALYILQKAAGVR